MVDETDKRLERARAMRGLVASVRERLSTPTGETCADCGQPATLGERPNGSTEPFTPRCADCYLRGMLPRAFPR
jgi:hypothetical protein